MYTMVQMIPLKCHRHTIYKVAPTKIYHRNLKHRLLGYRPYGAFIAMPPLFSIRISPLWGFKNAYCWFLVDQKGLIIE